MDKKRRMTSQTIEKVVKWAIRACIFITLCIYGMQHRKVSFLVVGLVLTFYKKPLEKLIRMEFTPVIHIAILVFIFTAQYLGSGLGLYHKIEWLDIVVHGLSGVLFTYIGMLLLKNIYLRYGRKSESIPIPVSILFGICFSLAIAVGWEVFEFTIDRFLGGNMQKAIGKVGQDALLDTMLDHISALSGAVLIGIYEGWKQNKEKRKEI